MMLLLSGVAILSGCSNKQKEFEEAVVLEIEQRVEKLRQKNPNDSIKYEIIIEDVGSYGADVMVIYNIETTQEPEIIGGHKFYSSYDYSEWLALFKGFDFLDSLNMKGDAYGEGYINGELNHTEKHLGSSSSSDSSSKKCSICGKSYSSGGTSNMCDQCYKNYKYASDAAGKSIH